MTAATRALHIDRLDLVRQHLAIGLANALLAADVPRATELRANLIEVNRKIARMKLPTTDPVASGHAALEEKLNGLLAVMRAGMRRAS